MSIIHVDTNISHQNTKISKENEEEVFSFTRTQSEKVNFRHKDNILQKIEEDVKQKNYLRIQIFLLLILIQIFFSTQMKLIL